MPTHSLFLNLLIILITARVFAEIAVRLNIPSVIGEMLAGIIIGPSVLGFVEPQQIIKYLAEIGIILLLFKVGLETNVKKLIHNGVKSSLVALTGFFLPLIFGFSLSYWTFGFSVLVSLMIGATLTATSIGITIRILSSINIQKTSGGQIILGAAVLDDILGVILLTILYEFSKHGEVSVVNVGKILLFIAAFFITAPIVAKLISSFIKKFDNYDHLPGLLPTTILALILFFGWLAHIFNVPEILGGFAAGLALSRRFFLPFGSFLHSDKKFAHNIRKQMLPIMHLFIPIFFVYIGLSFNLNSIDWGSPYIWVLSLSILFFAVIGKLFSALFITEKLSKKILIGLAMIPRGEIGLVFAELGRKTNIFNDEIYATMLIVILLSTLIPPFIMKWYCKKM